MYYKNFESFIIYVLVDKKLKIERLKKCLGVKSIFEEVYLVDFEWLSKCLFEGKFVDLEQYILGKDECKVEEKVVKNEVNIKISD